MNPLQLGTKSVSTLKRTRSRYTDKKRNLSLSSIREFVQTRNVTIGYCRSYMISQSNDTKLFIYSDTLFYNFNALMPVNSLSNRRKNPNDTMEITNEISKFVGALLMDIKLESNAEESKLHQPNIEEELFTPYDSKSKCSFKNELTQENVALLDADSTMSTDYSSSCSSKTSDNHILDCIGNALNDIGKNINISNQIVIEYEEKTNNYCDVYEDELRNRMEQELTAKIKGDMIKEFYERELQFKSQISTLQNALNESHANNTSQRTEIEEEHKQNEELQKVLNDQLNKILELQNENEELRGQLKDKQNEIDCFQMGVRQSLVGLKYPIRIRDEMKINNCDAGHESDSESSVITELSETKPNDVLYFIRMPVPIDHMINDKLNNKLKDELRKILAEVNLIEDDDEDEQKLDLFSVVNIFGEQNAEAMTQVFEQLAEENDDCDFSEFTIGTIINGIIASDDLKNKLIGSLNVKIENDIIINAVDMDNMESLILPNRTETQPNSKPFVPTWRKCSIEGGNDIYVIVFC